MKVHNLLVTGSLTSGGENISTISSSVSTTVTELSSSLNSRLDGIQTSTGSLNTFTSSANNRLNSVETSTGSLNTFTSSANNRLNSIESVTGSYATTGSNTFNGNLTVTGFIDAQELRTTYISSSILYRSGSTKFGDELTDTHAFTGSMLLSGSLTVNGTSTIQNTLTLNGSNNVIRSGNELRFNRADNAVYTRLYDAGSLAANGFILDNINGEGFHFQNNGTTIMRMNSSGRVGIGTNEPTENLQVNGSVRALQTLNDGIAQFAADASNTTTLRCGLATFGNTAVGNLIGLARASNSFLYKNGGALAVGTEGAYSLILTTSDTERIRITSGGDVGLGTDFVSWATGNRRVLEINGAAQVLIGLKTGNTQKGYIFHSGTNLFLENSNSAGDFLLTQVGAGNMTFTTNAIERMRITSTGAIVHEGLNVRKTKSGGTSVTFTINLAATGYWAPGYATVRVAGTRGGLQEQYAAVYFVKITYYQGSTTATTHNIGGDTGSASVSVSSALVSSQSQITITVSDAGATTDYLIADIDASFQTGIASIT